MQTMMMNYRAEMAQRFRTLHEVPDLLILPNVWDASSAKVIEETGAQAIATTSAGIAHAHGYADGNALRRDIAIDVVRAICRVVDVPVTADIEAGYGTTIGEIQSTAREIAEAGAVGINIEDGSQEPSLLAEKIRAIDELDSGLFINARTDVYLLGFGNGEDDRILETIRRAKSYVAAGADGVFVPGVRAEQSIERMTQAIDSPLNVLAVPGLPSPTDLSDLGVIRLSIGASLANASLGYAKRSFQALLTHGSYEPLFDGAVSSQSLNQAFAKGTT